MPQSLEVSIGQYSDKGRKNANQDFHGALIPDEPVRTRKGIAIALADGISSSPVSAVASETAVKSFLSDYYCTPDSWTVPTAAQRVISAANSWLFAETRRGQHDADRDKGYVCTFSVMVLKSRTAHLFHIGDSRIWRVSGAGLEQLTSDHRVTVSTHQSYLGRALGANSHVEIDYLPVSVAEGDVFVLTTDGVHEVLQAGEISAALAGHPDDLDAAACAVAGLALEKGARDNLTVQIVRVDAVPDGDSGEAAEAGENLPLPPQLSGGMIFEGYRILRPVHSSHRSHVWLAEDVESGAKVVVKVPSVDLGNDAAYRRRFLMEDWVARRINSANVLLPFAPQRPRACLYTATGYIDGQSLAQWMIDNPQPDLARIRDTVAQIAAGLRAFHRLEMVHQDLRPENILIDRSGTIKIIDFGSVRIAGVMEAMPDASEGILGTLQYTAPEYFLGEEGTWKSDQFSLGVITYQLLTGKLPYGAAVARTRTRAEQRKLRYVPVTALNRSVPAWVDAAIHKAVQVDPHRRYEALSEFLYDLQHPNPALPGSAHLPLAERNPLLFWKALSLLLGMTVAGLLLILLLNS